MSHRPTHRWRIATLLFVTGCGEVGASPAGDGGRKEAAIRDANRRDVTRGDAGVLRAAPDGAMGCTTNEQCNTHDPCVAFACIVQPSQELAVGICSYAPVDGGSCAPTRDAARDSADATVTDAGRDAGTDGSLDAERDVCPGSRPGKDSEAPPSCSAGGPGLTNCGPGGSGCGSCCATSLVTGGTYFRFLDSTPDGSATNEADPATLSGFELDTYDVTVGRFRQFVKAWQGGWLPAAGSGKHSHLNGGEGLTNVDIPGTYETGWLTTDDVNLAPTAANLACDDQGGTWTDAPGAQENLPIVCTNWYESYAFCIWDGGFLPSDAEWGYAAVGGSEQREYPWGATPPGDTNAYAVYQCDYAPCGPNVAQSVAPVGLPTLGFGRWGQVDLAGEISQWVLDWEFYGGPLDPCTDCAILTTTEMSPMRGSRGSGYFAPLSSLPPDVLSMPGGAGGNPARYVFVGFRCARTP